MNTTNFFIGQWVFFQFKLAVIESIQDNRVVEVASGYSLASAHDFSDVCFPLDIHGKIISEEFEHSYNKLYEKFKHHHLNWPDIHRWYVAAWRDLMHLRADKEKIEQGFRRLHKFAIEVKDTMTSLQEQTVQGVKLFRD